MLYAGLAVIGVAALAVGAVKLATPYIILRLITPRPRRIR